MVWQSFSFGLVRNRVWVVVELVNKRMKWISTWCWGRASKYVFEKKGLISICVKWSANGRKEIHNLLSFGWFPWFSGIRVFWTHLATRIVFTSSTVLNFKWKYIIKGKLTSVIRVQICTNSKSFWKCFGQSFTGRFRLNNYCIAIVVKV